MREVVIVRACVRGPKKRMSYVFDHTPTRTILEAVLECSDLAVLVLGGLDPASMVALDRVSRSTRAAKAAAIRDSPRLLVRAAENARALTKTQLMGWFALSSAEADALPRSQYMRRVGGFYFLYRQPAFEQVLGGALTGIADWNARLRIRQAADTRPRVWPYPQEKKRSAAWKMPMRLCR